MNFRRNIRHISFMVKQLSILSIVKTLSISRKRLLQKILFFRSSFSQKFIKEGLFKNFLKLTGKITSVPESLFDEAGCFQPATYLKKGPRHRYFPVKFARFLRTPFWWKPLEQLLLNLQVK